LKFLKSDCVNLGYNTVLTLWLEFVIITVDLRCGYDVWPVSSAAVSRLWTSYSHHCASLAKQYNLITT